MKSVKRGRIFLYDFGEPSGSKQGGYRPVLVIQNDNITKTSPEVLVAPLTSKIKHPNWFPHIYLGKRFGLEYPSMVLCEQITPAEKDKLKYYIGTVDDPEILSRLNRTVREVMGIKYIEPRIKNELRCLCQSHKEEYFSTNDYIVRRFNPFQVIKEKCDKCNRLGYDYLIIDKKSALRRGGKKNG